MRVTAGKYRSRPLRSRSGLDLRPTSDRLRETLFDVLAAADDLSGSVWIDLYAGSGAVGIEALSRGARTVYFVESSRRAAALIRENLRALGIAKGSEVMERKAAPALRLLDAAGVACDYCFLDPPYRMHAAYEETLGFLSQSRLLSPKSLVIAEHNKHFAPASRFGTLERRRELKQGDSVLSFYRLG